MKGANKDAIGSSISYIESRLLENLDIDELAGQVFFSKTHYQRLFHAIVGEPVMEYIKKRRLQQACQVLCQTNASVLEIALEYGYASHEGFTRAFKSLFGMTPTQFRKKQASGFNQKTIGKEVMDMVSSEVTKGIAQHTRTIAEALSQFKVNLEKLCVSAEKTAMEEGANGKGVAILVSELTNFAAKTGCLVESVKSFTGDGMTVFEISNTIYVLLKHVDDLAFQMHLLRFLSGIEVARTGTNTFTDYQNELTGLSNGLLNHHGMFTSILTGLLSLLLTDIRNEAVRSIRNATGLVNQTAEKGKKITEAIRSAALDIPSGTGFMRIAAEVEKGTAGVLESAAVIKHYAVKMEKEEPSAADNAAVSRAISTLTDIGFTMNLTGFNAAVEAARNGAGKTLSDCADEIKGYACLLHQTYTNSIELFSECMKLSGLLLKDEEEYPDSLPQKFQKIMDDILFQGGILAMQLGMESERANLAVFSTHAKNAEDAVMLLSKSRKYEFSADRDALSDYVNTIAALTKGCHTDADANMPQGMPFAYIAREFDVFVAKMSAALEKTKQ